MKRYLRNIRVIGDEAQDSLGRKSVAVVGCGALGGQCAMSLAGAGVGRIVIIDFDTVCISNLQRQLYFSEADAGGFKADVLSERMSALNSEIEVVTVRKMLTPENAAGILNGMDFVVEATDNAASKMLVEKTCRSLGVPCCMGGVAGWRGQVFTIADGSAGFTDLFPEASSSEELLPCEFEGVMGPVASLIASVQASEALKYLSGQGQLLTDAVFFADLRNNIYSTLSF